MVHIINPFIGSDDIKLGISTEEIQSIMGVEPKRVLKTEYDLGPIDHYDEIIVYYDDSKTCYMIDFTEPGEVLFNGTSIIGKPMKEIEAIFKDLDDDLRYDIINGFVSLKYDMAIYSETMDSHVESISVAKKGTYIVFVD